MITPRLRRAVSIASIEQIVRYSLITARRR
jgi:hypothetical protein